MVQHAARSVDNPLGRDGQHQVAVRAAGSEGCDMTSEPPQFRLTVRWADHHTAVIDVAGEVDMVTAPRLWQLLSCRLRGTSRSVLVDLSAVRFLAAAGLGVLVRAQQLAGATGISLYVVTGSSHPVLRALEATGLRSTLSVVRSADEVPANDLVDLSTAL
ncbi:STAS domain-containing protein [Amycolatopsis suaedae]|uniref:STAS domain-containing protein n=1 Tax=Amycolatopsis suaedae TaxID=2510978 RepID=UPI0013EF5685|nr:STAS domain-containing protein [Amycolatopsis suaedae]